MLLKLTVENFLSFKEKAVFTMDARFGKKLTSGLLVSDPFKKRLLPIAGIYGGDSTGYENFCKSLKFLKQMTTEAPPFVNSLNRFAFQNFPDANEFPTKIYAEILTEGSIFRYNFTAERNVVAQERLVKTSPDSALVLFERRKRKIHIDKSLPGADALTDMYKVMPKSQLFLSYSFSQKTGLFQELREWFSDALHVIGSEALHQDDNRPADRTHTYSHKLHDFIELVDQNAFSGRLHSREVPKNTPIREAVQKGRLTPAGKYLLNVDKKNSRVEVYYLHQALDEQKLLQLFPFERDSDWEPFILERPFASEMDKHAFVTRLSLADIQTSQKPKVYVLNRLEGAFDLIKAREIVYTYLEGCVKESQRQMIITTSNPLLLDKKLFRPDEIWISEPGYYGNYNLISLLNFKKTVKDKPVWKGVNTGPIGGIYTALLMAAMEVNAR
jgi:hypothetical protein